MDAKIIRSREEFEEFYYYKEVPAKEYPTGLFEAVDDSSALNQSLAKVVYRENDTPNGLPFVFLRQENSKEEY